ncbi:hypothetical protein ACFL0V_00455 [Nanoarchaeota archaeon]
MSETYEERLERESKKIEEFQRIIRESEETHEKCLALYEMAESLYLSGKTEAAGMLQTMYTMPSAPFREAARRAIRVLSEQGSELAEVVERSMPREETYPERLQVEKMRGTISEFVEKTRSYVLWYQRDRDEWKAEREKMSKPGYISPSPFP